MSDRQTYEEYKAEQAEALAGQTKEEVIRETGGIDLDNFPQQNHTWVDRGEVLSCENAGHPNHRSFKRR